MGCLGSFVAVGGPEGRNVLAEKEKGNVDDRVTAGLFVQVCLRIRALAKLGVELFPLDMTCCPPCSFKVTLRAQQAHGAERLLRGWWSLNTQCSIHSELGVRHIWPLLSLSLPLLFSSFPFLSTAWALDVVASWNAASPLAPSFLYRFRLSIERCKSSTPHTFGRCWRQIMWLSLSRRMLLLTAHGARTLNVWWTCHFVRASCCCRPDSLLGGGLLQFRALLVV